MKAKCLLDASALLALVLKEAGAETVAGAIAAGAAMSEVNLIEVLTQMRRVGYSAEESAFLYHTAIEFCPLNHAMIHLSVEIAALGSGLGLSLGDRVCLATACHLGLPVYTADKAWKKLAMNGLEVRLVR